MRKILRIVLFIGFWGLAVGISGCSNADSNNLNTQSPNLAPLSSEESKNFESLVDKAGNLERALLLQESGTVANSVLKQLRILVNDGSCMIQDDLHNQSLAQGNRRSLNVGGNSCPISAFLEETRSQADFKIRGQFTLLNPQLAEQNTIRSFSVSGFGSDSSFIRSQERRIRFASQGTLTDAMNRSISFVASSEFQMGTNTGSMRA